MSDNVRHSVDKELRQFAESLKASKEYIEEGRQLVDKVGRKLQEECSKYSIAKRLVGGSVGKNVEVIAPDFDVVVVVNNHDPPFEDVLDDFHSILLDNADNLRIVPKSLEKVGNSVQFSFENGIDVDLLVGANLTLPEVRLKMLAKPGRAQFFSSTMVEEAQEFMSRQDSFTHSLVRLVKFWLKSLQFGGKVFGGSTIVEQMCVAAATKEGEMAEKSLLRGFTSVIEMFEKLDKLKLAFEKDERDNWKPIPVQTLNSGNVRFGDWGYCNKDTLDKSYYIIEAINPFNNLLASLKPEMIDKFRNFAVVTGKRLSDLMDDKLKTLADGKERNILFEKLFEPQPARLKVEFPSGLPSDVTLSYSDPWSPYCDLKVRKKDKDPMARREIQNVVNALKYNLLLTANCIVRGGQERATIDNVRSSIKTLIETNLQVKISASKPHEDFDVTLSVPYLLNGAWYATRLSMSWKLE